jgi:type IX secretion system PorP/SprF family membrane protein
MKKTLYILSFLVLFFAGNLKAQDIHFSQVNEVPLFLSPANTGFYNGYFRAIINYRNQWSAMDKAFQTYAVSIDGGLFKSKRRKAFLGMGLTVFRDQAGAAKLNITNAMFNVSGLVKLSRRSVLSAGVGFGVAATNGDYSKLIYETQFDGNNFDPSSPTGEKVVYRQFTTYDLSAGLAYEFSTAISDQDHDDVRSFKIALGGYHLNKPEQNYGAGSQYNLPVRWVAAFSSHFDFEDTKFSLAPSVVYQQQEKFQELMAGTYLKYRTRVGTKTTGKKTENGIGIGLFYRYNDALVPKLIYEAGDFAVGVSYDVNLSGYRTASRYKGGFEVSLRYNNLASSLFDARKEYR